LNKNIVKELTREGCIVAKEAAESINESDVEVIKSLDSTPMYISEAMLENLRKKAEKQSNGQKVKEKPVPTANGGSTTEQVTRQEKPNVENTVSETESSGEEKDSLDPDKLNNDEEDNDKDSGNRQGNNSQEVAQSKGVKIMDDRERKELRTKVEIMDEKEVSRSEKDVPEFLKYYNDRYDKMRKLLTHRMELQSATTVNRLERRDEGEEATTVGLVKSKYQTNSGKYIVELEDKTGTFKALVDDREGERIVPDEMIGVIGSMGGDIIYADSIIRADMPIPQGMNTTEQKVSAAYISDLHIGSKDTLNKELNKFGDWLSSSEANNVGYLVITGDVVEGVGTYPGQEEELEITDIYKQYNKFEKWVEERLPEDLQVIIGPGNHDITRLAEPQPKLPEKVFPTIKDFNNVHLVQNPQMVRLHGIESKGIKNLMYHGYSFDDHADQIQELREKGYEHPHHIMIDLLKRRHLAPTYGSNSLSPEGEDSLVIEEEPDVFVSGHFHSHSNESYKGVNVINSSTFQAQTDFQKRVGHEPDPGKVTIVDYKTRNTKVKKFV
jgi:DNA polymerase II small subunit